MRILLIGSGGREHALAWALCQSEICNALYCAPGNAGIEGCAECVDLDTSKIDLICEFVTQKSIDFVVVGPEAPLVAGLADRLRDMNIDVFGPSAAAAQLEGSKAFTKELCRKYDIPTADYGRFQDSAKAREFIEAKGAPLVVKADGLAAGKGVIICETNQEAIEAAENMLSGGVFGDAGREIVIEEFLVGEELSYFALADGKTIAPLTSAQDHKRAYDGNTGPNTGGMGAYSPAHLMNDVLEKKIIERIIQPTVDAMNKEGIPYTGVLYAGLMIVNGDPYLIEYNARFGDPECQPLMLRFKGDLGKVLHAASTGNLETAKDDIRWSDEHALCVVMAANGYPGSYEKNTTIKNLEEASKVEGVTVFHAGTKLGPSGLLKSTGGRVLGITAKAGTIEQARNAAYEAVDLIDWPDGFCRSDIGWRALDDDKKEAS